MNPYSFAEHVGDPIFIGLVGVIVDEQGNQQNWISAELLNSEPGGLWVRSKKIDVIFEKALWDFELEHGGEQSVGTLEFAHFIPFAQIRFAKLVLPRSTDGTKQE